MRESEKERKSEWLSTVSLFPQITLLFCSIINAPKGWEAAGRPEIALLFFFYILLDFLKIQAAFLPRSGISRASCLYAQTWAGDNQPGKPSRHVLGRGNQQSPFTLQNREDDCEEWGDFIWQEYLAARIQGEGTAVTCSPSSCWGLSRTPSPRVGIARSHPVSLSNNFRWDGLPNKILTYYLKKKSLYQVRENWFLGCTLQLNTTLDWKRSLLAAGRGKELPASPSSRREIKK